MELDEKMTDPVLIEIIERLKAVEDENKLLKEKIETVEKNLIPTIREVTTWHTHAMNGKIYWEIPKEILEKLQGILKKEKHFKENIPKPDDSQFSATLIPVTPEKQETKKFEETKFG
jgi:hypothetical protein